MRRVLRHFFTACSALSLLLCVATAVLWARSYWVTDVCATTKYLEDGRVWQEVVWVAKSQRGRIAGGRNSFRVGHRDVEESRWTTFTEPDSQFPAGWFAHFKHRINDVDGLAFSRNVVMFPHWCVVGATLVLPVAFELARRRRWRRHRQARDGQAQGGQGSGQAAAAAPPVSAGKWTA
jgi:hypothetical protein